jgi:stage II sporulation protein AA (anti-sigma F factor antagonist)
MTLKFENNNNILIASILGEIDHHNAKDIREGIDKEIESCNPKSVVLNFRDVGFMDSSGIGLIMGRYKLVKQMGGTLKVVNISTQMKRIMMMAGLDRLSVIEK